MSQNLPTHLGNFLCGLMSLLKGHMTLSCWKITSCWSRLVALESIWQTLYWIWDVQEPFSQQKWHSDSVQLQSHASILENSVYVISCHCCIRGTPMWTSFITDRLTAVKKWAHYSNTRDVNMKLGQLWTLQQVWWISALETPSATNEKFNYY